MKIVEQLEITRPTSRWSSVTLYVVTGAIIAALLLTVYSIAAASAHSLLTIVSGEFPSGWSVTFNVIALLAAVAGLIALLWGLGLTKRREALGMPANSVRALLALIVLIMLSTLSAEFFNAMSSPAVEVAAFTDLSAENLADAKTAGFTLLILSHNPAKPELLSGKIFRPGVTPAAQDLAKTMSSALITLLTAIISFYFGSQAAREGARTAIEGQQAQTQPNQNGGGGGTPDVEANAAKAMFAGAQQKLAALGDDPMKLLKEALTGASPEVTAKFDADMKAAQQALDAAKSAVASCQTHAKEAASAASDASALNRGLG